MTDDYKFGLDDVGPDTETESEDSNSSVTGLDMDGLSATGLFLLPVSVLAVYAFTNEAAVMAAMVSLFGGATMVATIVTTALWVVGFIVLAFLAIVAVGTVAGLLFGIVKQSGAQFALGLLGSAYFGASYYLYITLFSHLPLLVGFILASNLLIYGGIAAVGMLITVVALGLM